MRNRTGSGMNWSKERESRSNRHHLDNACTDAGTPPAKRLPHPLSFPQSIRSLQPQAKSETLAPPSSAVEHRPHCLYLIGQFSWPKLFSFLQHALPRLSPRLKPNVQPIPFRVRTFERSEDLIGSGGSSATLRDLSSDRSQILRSRSPQMLEGGLR